MSDPVAKMGVAYRAGAKKQRADETRAAFANRVRKTFPEVIRKSQGSFDVAAETFNVDHKLLRAITANDSKCQRAFVKARATEAAAKARNEDVYLHRKGGSGGDEPRDTRLKRQNWPIDDSQKEKDVRDALLVSLIENAGDVPETCKCLNLDLPYVVGMLDDHEDIEEARSTGVRIGALEAEAALLRQAKSGNVSAIKSVLTNRGDNWNDKQTVDVNHSGFQPPQDTEKTTGSILEIFKGSNDEEDSA